MNKKESYSIYKYMKETAKVVDKVSADGFNYLKNSDINWRKHKTKLYSSVSHLVLLRKGEKARQTLVRLAFEAVSTKDWKKDHIVPSIASSIEILSTSTYVIDDILDHQPERYGNASTWKMFGINLGILAGYLQDNIAREVLRKGIESLDDKIKVKILDLYADIIRQVNEGQVLNEFMKEETIVDEYLDRTYKACGTHFENPAVMAGLAGNATEKELKLLKEIGRNIGIAYWIRNDLFNYIPQEIIIKRNSKALRRTSYEDLKKGIWTYPIIWLMDHGIKEDKDKIKNMLGKEKITSKMLIEATKILIKSGAAMATIEFMNKYRKEARKNIKKLKESRAKRLLFIYDNMFDNAQEYVDEFKNIFM